MTDSATPPADGTAGGPAIVAEPVAASASAERAGVPSRRHSGWSKTIVNFWVDCSLLAMFLALWWVSAVLHLLFPAGAAARRWTLWGRSVTDWQNIQFALLCLFTGGILLHLMLHWTWIMGVVSTRFLGRKPNPDHGAHTLVGVGVLIALLHLAGLAFLIASACMSHGG